MIVSHKLQQTYAKMWSAGILLSAMLVVPVGAVDARDFEAVERRLGKAVSKGELSLHQAKVMMDVLRETAGHEHESAHVRERIEQQLRAVGAELKAAAAAGKITEEQAWDKWNGFKEHEIAPQLKAAVREGQMSEREAWEIWRGIEKAEAGERLKAAVAKGELTEEEAKAKWAEIEKGRRPGHDKGVKAHFARMGIDLRTMERVAGALKEGGLEDEQLERTLGGMLRVVHEIKAEGEEFEMDPRLRRYFADDIKLTDKQIELVLGLSRRIAYSLKKEAHPRHQQRGSREEAVRRRWAGIRERIEGAVKRGDMTREEADAKYAEIKKEMKQRRTRSDEAEREEDF